MASLLAVQFSQEADESKALTSVALIGLAAAVGVKEAKKKSLKLTRWSKAPPLPLATLLPLDEQHAALLALAKIQSPWALSFINQSLADPALTLALLPDLLKWGRAASPDWAAFVAETYAGAVANCTESARAIAMLKKPPRCCGPLALHQQKKWQKHSAR